MSQPNADSQVLGSKKEHDFVEVYSIVNGWACIKYESGTGFVDQYCIKLLDEEEPIKEDLSPRPIANTPLTQPTNPNEIIIMAGTEIPLKCTQEISAKTAKVGQKVNFTVAKNVIVDGFVLIKRGANVEGVVYESQTAKEFLKDNKSIRRSIKKRVDAVQNGKLGKLGVKIEGILLSNNQFLSFADCDVQGFYELHTFIPQKKIPEGFEVIASVASTTIINKNSIQ